MAPTAKRQTTPAPGRQRLTGERRRESILTVALRAFAARGYEGVRTQELAEAAGVSEALIYQHFGSKRELYGEVVDRSSEALRERLTAALERDDSRRLERALEDFVEFVADRSSGWALLVSTVGDPEIQAYQREARRTGIAGLTELFVREAAQPRSAVARRQLEQLAEAVAGGAEALAHWWAENPKSARREGTAMLVDFARRNIETIAGAAGRSRQAKKRGNSKS
jgi:AcrR family transcriptional regulator